MADIGAQGYLHDDNYAHVTNHCAQIAGMVLALLTIPSASIQWYRRYMQCGSPLDARTGKGVVPLGHATWAAVLACLVEAKESTEGEEERVTCSLMNYNRGNKPVALMLEPS